MTLSIELITSCFVFSASKAQRTSATNRLGNKDAGAQTPKDILRRSLRNKIREVRKTSRVHADDGCAVESLKADPSTLCRVLQGNPCLLPRGGLPQSCSERRTHLPQSHCCLMTMIHQGTYSRTSCRPVRARACLNLSIMPQLYFLVLLFVSFVMCLRSCQVPGGSRESCVRGATAIFHQLQHYQQSSQVSCVCNVIKCG